MNQQDIKAQNTPLPEGRFKKGETGDQPSIGNVGNIADKFAPKGEKRTLEEILEQSKQGKNKAVEVKVENEIQTKPGPMDSSSLTANTSIKSDFEPIHDEVEQGWTRTGLPSKCIFYDFNDVKVKPFGLPELVAINAAVQNRSVSMFYDAMNPCLNVDIRDLTASDLKFLMYWWRLNSFSRSPFTVKWNSRYGNECQKRVPPVNDLKIIELKITKDEYLKFKEKGIYMPTLRELEMVEDPNRDTTNDFLLQRAQYILSDTTGENYWTDRIDKLNAGGIPLLEDIRDFAELIEHGVEETITVTDENFKPEEAAKFLLDAANVLEKMVEQADNQSAAELGSLTNRVVYFRQEAEEIEQALKAGEEVKPKEENIVLTINTMDFFPGI